MTITPFKVIDFGTNQKPIYDSLLEINTNLLPILHHFQVIADYVRFYLATGGHFTLMPPLGVIPCIYPESR